ncbi:beta-lactamase/transpeptidase-like protein [Dactylonectria macrodidyma]|uniref:Beta-lactamase/transpeptidase-like protein n=1 Tax=Dactylonectria macrodidyma TaxID=307937 RepID=A0A9P9IHB7_9HYPO|nr:beta-lactamase/transpeptidase-like protein [Dactylonectria macrodidyma]
MKFYNSFWAIPTLYACTTGADFVLRHGSPSSVDMQAQPLRDMVQNISAYAEPRNYGTASKNETRALEPGSVNLVARYGVIVSSFATGKRKLYADANGTLLNSTDQEDATLDTIYDLASISKLFTAVAILREVDAGRIELHAPAALYLPEFGVNGKENITILNLLTHTGGLLPLPTPDLWKSNYSSIDERVATLLSLPPQEPANTVFLYSDIGYMTLRYLLERVTGYSHELLVYSYTIPLGMKSTFYNRGNLEGPLNPFYHRVAPTEFEIQAQGLEEPQRPQPVRGTVHDENTWALDGVSGHAGLFSTVEDVAIFCQMILNNGTYHNFRVLSKRAVDLIFTDFNSKFPGNNYGAGFALNQTYTQGSMRSLQTASHSGFTGTTLAIDRPSGTFWIHFSNRVHPSRWWSTNNPARMALGYWVAKSLGRSATFPIY